jgi:hypothetical protein
VISGVAELPTQRAQQTNEPQRWLHPQPKPPARSCPALAPSQRRGRRDAEARRERQNPIVREKAHPKARKRERRMNPPRRHEDTKRIQSVPSRAPSPEVGQDERRARREPRRPQRRTHRSHAFSASSALNSLSRLLRRFRETVRSGRMRGAPYPFGVRATPALRNLLLRLSSSRKISVVGETATESGGL